ncbi:ATP-binding protein [Streptacidiphilus cavernicola]|uniref:ATP-binding protein n=1 Tax=Streptacidiphilus cavernicola TaxID=3342716 RepID=A0ABV6W2U6_9ACTN
MSTTRSQGPDGARAGLPPGGQTRRLALSGTRGVVGRCRDFTRTALHDWNWLPARNDEQEAVAEDVLLLVSELVTNACLHAEGPTELALHCTDTRLRVEVSDHNALPPVPRTPHQATRPGGHGLHIVSRLAQDWGTEIRSSDKTVWLEVRSPLGG